MPTTLTERIQRDSVEDQIYLGQLVERATKGEFGDLFRLICNGIQSDTLQMSERETSKLPADRYLGRLEGINKLQERLILMVQIKENLVAEKRSSQRVNSGEAD